VFELLVESTEHLSQTLALTVLSISATVMALVQVMLRSEDMFAML
jgi:hypothetical protein